MARIIVRYLTRQPGGTGALPRYFWQPSSMLRAQGWRTQRVPANWADFSDGEQLLAAAIARANELNAELDAARAQQPIPVAPPPVPSSGTVRELISAYQASDKWQRLAPATQRGYRQALDRIDAWAGDAPVRAIDAARIAKLRAGMRRTPSFGNAVVRVLRLLLEFGRRNTMPGTVQPWVRDNPALRPDLAGAPPSGLIWPPGAVEAFVIAADALQLHSIGTAVLLNEWLGQREGDILRMPRSVYRKGQLVLRQSKTGAGVTLPIDMVPHLRDRLEKELARLRDRQCRPGAMPASTIIVSETTGQPYKPDHFRHAFAAVRARAAATTPSFEIDYLMPGRDMNHPQAFHVRMMDLTYMALRHTAVTRLAEAGCDTTLIASITGHSQATVQALMERYMVRTAELARVAFGRRLEAEKEKEKKA